MNRAARALAVPLALILCLCLTAVPVQAADVSYGYVHLLDDGGEEVSNATDWQFDVPTRSYLLLTDDNWTLTVTARLINGTGAAVAGTYNVTMYVNDGTANRSATVQITTSKTAAVTGQLVFDSADVLALKENGSALVYVTLDKGGVVLDSYSYTTDVTANQMQGISSMMMALLLGPVITLVILGAMTGWIGDLLKGLGGSMGGFGGGKKRSKK